MITRNQIFTNVATAFRAAYPNGKAYANRVRTPAAFPCLWCVEQDRYSPQRNVTFTNDDEQYQVTFEVQVFSDVSANECREILDAVEQVFKGMGFRLQLRMTMDNYSDTDICRELARFTRTIGGGDTLGNET